MPPISLLYGGFGVFDDVILGSPIGREDDNLEVMLCKEVDAFAHHVARFHTVEADLRMFSSFA